MSRLTSGPVPPRSAAAQTRRDDGLLIALPLLALLCLQAGLFVWMAPRGLDFTDESYYLLNYLHWRDFTATVTFFGAYFDAPFRLLGQQVAAIRIFGMVMLISAGGFFAWRAMAFDGDRDRIGPRPLPFVVGGMVASLFYYSYVSTLRAPSYNLLVLFCMLVATGLLLTLVEGRGSRSQRWAAALAYGLVLGACALGKVTSAVAMMVCHGVFFAAFSRQRRLLDLAGPALTGVAINFVVLQLLQPGWLQVLRDGVTLTTTLDGRYTSVPFATLWDAVLRGAVRLLPALALAALVFVVVVRRWGRVHRLVLSAMVVLLVAGIMLTIQLQGYGKSWWALLLFGTVLLWLAERLCRERALPARAALPTLGLTILLFALPVAYSIGTNGSLPAHTQMAAVFGVVAMMLPLRRLWALELIHPGALVATLATLCLPTLVLQLRSLDDPSFTYRQRTGLLQQQWPVALGAAGDEVRVDAVTRANLEGVMAAVHEAGYIAGEPILDVSGDGPGLVYALGGRPVGVAWLIGGYAGSERVASRVLNSVPVTTLQQAWVLSVDDNPRALRSWARLLQERAGETSHELATSVPFRAQYRWDGLPPEPLTLSVWKPRGLVPIRPLDKQR